MVKIITEEHLQRQWRKREFILHLRFGINQMRNHPTLLLLLIPIVVLTVIIWMKMDFFLSLFRVHKVLNTVYTVSIKVLGVLLPLILLLGLIYLIGTLFSRKDEGNVQMAFGDLVLRNGCPIMTKKCRYTSKTQNGRSIKTDIVVRVWYSTIPVEVWRERCSYIEHALNVHLIEDFDYEKEKNKHLIMMVSRKGNRPKDRGAVYDDEF